MIVPDDKPVSLPKYKTFAPFTDEELEALNVAHGDVQLVRGETPPAKSWRPLYKPEPPWECVFRTPNSGECAFFERALHKDTKDMALRAFAKGIVAGVSYNGKKTFVLDNDPLKVKAVREAFDNMRERYGLAHIACNDALMSLSGMVANEEGKE